MGAAEQLTFVLDKPRVINHRCEWLARYSKFKDIYDFNNEYEKMMVEKKKRFTKLQHTILNVVRKYGAKVPGVVNASYRTLIERIEEVYGHKVHAETIANTINKAESMGILVKLHAKRIDGSYAANVLIFNRYDEMTAYEIANLKAKEEEIAKQLEEEYAAMSPVLNYAANARKWAEEKQRKEEERKKAEEQAAAKAREMEQKQKKETLYTRLLTYVHAKKITKEQFEQLNKILYGERKKIMKADPRLTEEQADNMVFGAFINALNKQSKVKNLFAFVTGYIRRTFKEFKEGYKPSEYANKRSQSSTGRTEIVPEWFNDRNDYSANKAQNNMIDFEEERRKVLEKLGKQ